MRGRLIASSIFKYLTKPLIIFIDPAAFRTKSMGHSFQHMGFHRDT